MKLSYNFFCIAYIIVLLATGVGGILVINNVNNTLWNTQVERVKATVNYVADSFLAFADVSYSEIPRTHKNNIVRQIKDSLDNSVVEIEIHHKMQQVNIRRLMTTSVYLSLLKKMT